MSAETTTATAPAQLEAVAVDMNDAVIPMSGRIATPTAESGDGANTTEGMVARMKSFVEERRKHVKPWNEFINPKRMRKPGNVSETTKRIMHNVHEFKANYVFIMMVLALYSVLTSPLLLMALVFLGISVQAILYDRKDRVIMGKTLTKDDQLKLAGVVTLPMLWFSAAGGTIFWVVGASLCVMLVHAALLPVPGDILADLI